VSVDDGIVIVCFAPGPRGRRARGAGGARAGGLEPSRQRWFAPGLLSAQLEALDEDVLARLRQHPAVTRALALGGRPLALRREGGPAVVRIGDVPVGEGGPVLMAGPCSVESAEQVADIAGAVRAAGARVLRGGAFKPRTSPYAFAGLGEAGLEHLARARELTGLPVVTEALAPEDLDVVARYADAVQIGSRNMQNFPLLWRAGSHPAGLPVLLKRGSPPPWTSSCTPPSTCCSGACGPATCCPVWSCASAASAPSRTPRASRSTSAPSRC